MYNLYFQEKEESVSALWWFTIEVTSSFFCFVLGFFPSFFTFFSGSRKKTSTSFQLDTNIRNYSSHSRKFIGYVSSIRAMPTTDGSGQTDFKLISHTRRYLLKRTIVPNPLALHRKCLFPAHFWQVFTAWAISRSPGHFLQKLFSKNCKGQGMMRHYSHCKWLWENTNQAFLQSPDTYNHKTEKTL